MDCSSSEEKEKLSSAVKRVEDKHTIYELKALYWSPKMDLVAEVTLAKPNNVILFRLHSIKKKVWSHPSPSDDGVVTSVAWEPSGKSKDVALD